MSKEKTPVLAGTIPSFERFMTSWEKLAKKPENKHLAPAIKVGLKFAYKYYKKMDDTIAYVLAMRESNYIFIFESAAQAGPLASLLSTTGTDDSII
jgi:hypothetical protein